MVALAVGIFGSSLERRLGTIATLLLALACGALGMLAADGIEPAAGDGREHHRDRRRRHRPRPARAWLMIKWAEVRSFPDEDFELIGVAAAAAVLIALPLIDDAANVLRRAGGAAVGPLAGGVASLSLARRGA